MRGIYVDVPSSKEILIEMRQNAVWEQRAWLGYSEARSGSIDWGPAWIWHTNDGGQTTTIVTKPTGFYFMAAEHLETHRTPWRWVENKYHPKSPEYKDTDIHTRRVVIRTEDARGADYDDLIVTIYWKR